MKIFLYTVFLCTVLSKTFFAGSDYYITIRDDNDISTYKDTTSKQERAPEAVNTKLNIFLTKKLADVRLDALEMYKYVQTFRITTPDSNYIFIAAVDEGRRGLQFYLFYFSVKQNVCSDYLNIDGYFMKDDEDGFKEWNGQMIEKPYISFKDVSGSGVRQVIFNRRSHNGNLWNAVETIIIRINGSSQPEKWFSYFSKEIKGYDQDILIKRTLKSVTGTSAVFGLSEFDFKTGRYLQSLNDEIITIKNSGE